MKYDASGEGGFGLEDALGVKVVQVGDFGGFDAGFVLFTANTGDLAVLEHENGCSRRVYYLYCY